MSTLVDAGFESGTDGATLSAVWTNSGTPQRREYDAAQAKVGSLSAWIQGAAAGGNAGVYETASGGMTSDGAERRYWLYFDSANESRLIEDFAAGLAAADRVTQIQFSDAGNINILTDHAGNPNGYTTSTFTAVGTYTTGWTQFREVYDFASQTYTLSKRAATTDAWTQLKAAGATGYAIPMRGTNTITQTHGTLWRGLGNAELWLDELRYDNDARALIPDAPTLSGVAGGAYGEISGTITAAVTGGAASGVKLFRSTTEGGTYSEVTSASDITGSGPWGFTHRRPMAVPDGTTFWYKAKATTVDDDSPLSSALSATSALDLAAITTAKLALLKTLTDAQASDVWDSTATNPLQAYSLVALARHYSLTADAAVSGFIDNQYANLIGASYLTADDLWHTDQLVSGYITRHGHARTALYLYVASRLLRQAGDTTRADTYFAKAQAMAWAMIDHLGTAARYKTCAWPSAPLANSQAAWTARAFVVNEIVKPSVNNNHQYVCLEAHTGTTEPTWSTTAGALCSGTDGTKWREDTAMVGATAAKTFCATYNATTLAEGSASYYTADLNQQAAVAALLAMFYMDASSTMHDSATVKSYIDNELAILVRSIKWSTGQVPIGSAYETTYDTLYARYTLHLFAVVLFALGSAYDTRMTDYIDRALDWLDATWVTEPNLGGDYYNAPHGVHVAEMMYAHVAYDMLDRTDANEAVFSSAAFNRTDNDKSGDYVQSGVVVADPDDVQAHYWIGPALVASLKPVPVAALTAAWDVDHIDVTWPDIVGETGYHFERKVDAGSWVALPDLAADAESYADTDVTSESTYTYRIQAFNDFGVSAWVESNEVSLGTSYTGPACDFIGIGLRSF